MTGGVQMLILVVTLFSAVTTQLSSQEEHGIRGKFSAPNGGVIQLNTKTGTLATPWTQGSGLKDCSDKVQVCLTDNHGFAFAYFRKCNGPASHDYKGLKFHPKIVSVLHNDMWLVFDAAPNYMFHYDNSKGLVGIYLGQTPSFDFRSLLHDRNFKVSTLDAMEYRVSGSDRIAACVE
jgi:hypothetical protein